MLASIPKSDPQPDLATCKFSNQPGSGGESFGLDVLQGRTIADMGFKSVQFHSLVSDVLIGADMESCTISRTSLSAPTQIRIPPQRRPRLHQHILLNPIPYTHILTPSRHYRPPSRSWI